MAGDLSQDDTVAAPSQPTVPVTGGGGATAPLRARAERYKLGAVLGKGGMGEVCAAVDEDIGRDVAVKRLRSPDAGPEAIARFLREARIQARLDHPAIVPVHDLGAGDDGRPFFAMKRLAGTTLAEIVARGGLDAQRPRLLRAFVDVCLAAEFAHTRGVVHRDLKPANIVLGDFGEVYVLDWGIARVLSDPDQPTHGSVGADVATLDTGGTSAGAVLGTPGYMPPEQLRGEAGVDARADVYALGCVLFEILAGQPLHPRGSAAVPSTLGGAADARPSARGSDCPPELEAACVRATRTEPADRFATARALGDAVQAFLDGDRDLQLRRALAATHVEAAEAAIAGGTTSAARARAMREAGRALALDPTSAAAAAVVTRLMLEPPDELPPEVTAELREHDRASSLRQGRLAIRALASYGLFIPFLFWMHISGWTWVVLTYAVVALAIGQAWLTTRKGDPLTAGRATTIVGVNVVIVALMSRMFGPYVLAPALAAGVLGGMAGFPPLLKRYNLVYAAFALAFVAPIALEHAGVWSQTTYWDSGVLAIRSAVVDISWRTEIMLVTIMLTLLYVAGRFAHQLAVGNHAAQEQLQVHAWHLRQLVPDDAARAPAPPVDVPDPTCIL
jgi:serine/threonine-protein kinase